MEVLRAEHHLTRLEYHLVLTPKYRCRAFRPPYTTVLKKLFVRAAYDYDREIREIEIPPDHAHMLVAIPPQIAVSDAIRVLKSITARCEGNSVYTSRTPVSSYDRIMLQG